MSVETDTQEPTDREVGRRLRRAIRSADTARDDDEYPDDLYEWEFVSFVIPALEARGLGEQYVHELHFLVWVTLGNVTRDAISEWMRIKAPLSLRARAALQVLEHGQ